MPTTQPANTGIGNGGTGANTGAGGYSVTISPNGQMTITQGGRPVYTGPVQGTSLTYNQSGQLVGYNAPKSSPITTTAQPSAPAQSSPVASPPTPRAGASGGLSSDGSSNTATQTATATPTTTSNQVDYPTFGQSAQISWGPSENGLLNPNFTVKVPLPNGRTFTYSGSVAGVPLGSQMAIDQAIDQAWQAYIQGTLAFPKTFGISSVSVGQSTQGLTMAITPTNITPAKNTQYQQVTVAP